MKKMIFALSMSTIILFAGTPTINGSFDGVGVWGSAIATADNVGGWNGANAKNIYVTFDDNFYYFGAEVSAADWNDWGFAINTGSGGGTSEPWGRSIDFGHSNLPDYVIKGHFGDPNDNNSNSPYAELRTWNGSSWTSTVYTSNIGENESAFIEVKVAKSDIGNPSVVFVQFYITGNNGSHGTFDACPDDQIADSWDESSGHNILDSYSAETAMPVELTSFSLIVKGKGIELAWKTASEANNHGFDIERKQSGAGSWTKIGFSQGQGTTNTATEYSFTDHSVTSGRYEYRLKQIDRDGKFEYSSTVEASVAFSPASVELSSNYPNPFNPSTSISFTLGTTGKASLKVYDVLGKQVASITEGVFNAGEVNTFSFNAAGLTSGVYYYRLTSDTKVETRKMLLMK